MKFFTGGPTVYDQGSAKEEVLRNRSQSQSQSQNLGLGLGSHGIGIPVPTPAPDPNPGGKPPGPPLGLI